MTGESIRGSLQIKIPVLFSSTHSPQPKTGIKLIRTFSIAGGLEDLPVRALVLYIDTDDKKQRVRQITTLCVPALAIPASKDNDQKINSCL
jgi:hypothetical protein